MTEHDRNVGVIGLGLVGRALAGRLTAAGWQVLGHDAAQPAMAAWREAGGQTAEDLARIARDCPSVVMAVYDTTGVLAVADTLLALKAGSAAPSFAPRVLVDCSTGDPQALRELAPRLHASGIDFIESPLSGSSEQIARGEATALLGAHMDALQRHAALLAALAPRQIHAGGPGMGAQAKLATNLVLGLNRAALAEGLVFAQALGLDPAKFLDMVLATPARSDAALAKGTKMVNQDFAPQSRIRQHLKDIDLMLAAATAAGQRLPLTQTHAALLRAAVQAGDGDLDNAAVLLQIRRETFTPPG